jgi:hypothetical protein
MVVTDSFTVTDQVRNIFFGFFYRVGLYAAFFLPSLGLRPTPFKMSLNKLMVVESIM